MPDFMLYRLRDDIENLSSVVFREGHQVDESDVLTYDDFTVQLFMTTTPRQRPRWLDFISQGFPAAATGWRPSTSRAALLTVRALDGRNAKNFALAFGQGGRFLLRRDSFVRRFGLLTALNLVTSEDSLARLRALDTTAHRQTVVRSRLQATSSSTVDVFELDTLRELVKQVTGVQNRIAAWGSRVGGSDAIHITADILFEQLGTLCLRADEVFRQDDYKAQFPWIDNISPVTDPTLLERLEDHIVDIIRDVDQTTIQLAPPEIVDWDRLERFLYHFEGGRRPTYRRDIDLRWYLTGLQGKYGDLNRVNPSWLKSQSIKGVNADRQTVHQWDVWRCLVGEFQLDGQTYVIDDGSLYEVEPNFLNRINTEIVRFTRQQPLLPPSVVGTTEPIYNQSVADNDRRFLLLDADEVTYDGFRGGVELCDLLGHDKQLIHVKRYTGSSTLSHLFAQAATSAELLQTNNSFRSAAREKVHTLRPDGTFDFIEEDAITTSEFEVVLAIIRPWNGRAIDSLPFFAKINLQHVITDLTSRNYRVSVERVETRVP